MEISVIREALVCGTHGVSGKWRNLWILERAKEKGKKESLWCSDPFVWATCLLSLTPWKHHLLTISVLESEQGKTKTLDTSDLSIETLISFSNFLLSCYIKFSMQKKQLFQRTPVQSRCSRLKINELVNAGALCYFLTTHLVKYSISVKQTPDSCTFSQASLSCFSLCVVCVCECVLYVRFLCLVYLYISNFQHNWSFCRWFSAGTVHGYTAAQERQLSHSRKKRSLIRNLI